MCMCTYSVREESFGKRNGEKSIMIMRRIYLRSKKALSILKRETLQE